MHQPGRFPKLVDLVADLRRNMGGESFDLQHDRREDLAHLVELTGDTLAFGLLHRQSLTCALPPLVPQATEHLVERLGKVGDVGLTHDRYSLPRVERVDRPHGRGHRVERAERRPQQRVAEGQRHE
jgi:hypothetical protein